MKMTRSLKRFVWFYLVLHLAAILIFLAVLSPWLHNQLVQQVKQRMLTTANLLSERLEQAELSLDNPQALTELRPLVGRTEFQLSLWTNDQQVIGLIPDQAVFFEGARPEIRTATRDGVGFDRRSQGAERKKYLFLAVAHPRSRDHAPQGFLCLSVAEQAVIQSDSQLRWVLISFGLSLAVLAAVLMWTYAAREMEPLREFSDAARRIAVGQYDDVPAVLNRDDEWRNLSDAFRQMQVELGSRETRLAENSQRLEAVLSSMIEGVLAIDSHGQVMLANLAACEMLGISQSHLLNRKLLELVRIPQLRAAIEHTQLNRTFGTVEFQTLDLPRKTISARVSVLTDERMPGVTIVMQDVSELRQLENMRRDFVANVSHELKTPLSSIKAYAETLSLGAIDDPEHNRQFVQQIEIQAQALQEQIMDLLQLAKIESGQTLLDIGPVSIQEICQEVIRIHSAEADSRQIQLSFQEAAHPVLAQADREALRTIADNLITNAIRYTPENGAVVVSCSLERNEVVLSVSDTGIGIASEHQPRIFERFYRVDRARSRELGGTGLGLSIVKHLVQVMGGSIHLTSKVGKGSTFSVRLPAAKQG